MGIYLKVVEFDGKEYIVEFLKRDGEKHLARANMQNHTIFA